MVRVDTAALRTAAKQLRDEAADVVGEAVKATGNAERRTVLSFAFDEYGSHDGYQSVAKAWRNELDVLAEALRQLAGAMEQAADNYDRSDGNAQTRLDGVR
ncbi:type VII secretion target [Plantactinospora sp. B6F1]|uniref:type VII secretion target n=1 Tax=Plantactinospora sp. B6F1 TaxID=3158971 RepID=UPI0032D9159A